MTPNAPIDDVKYVALSYTIPLTTVWPWISEVKITRNSSGNAKVKNADAGFRQNALFV
jgi:hypothetical protein